MKMSSESSYKDVENFFAAPLTPKQKAWLLIDKFYHLNLSHMEENGITRAQLAQQLGRSKASISQMFNKTPNISVQKMVEIAEATGVELDIVDLEKQKELEQQKEKKVYKVVTRDVGAPKNEFELVAQGYDSYNKSSSYFERQECEITR